MGFLLGREAVPAVAVDGLSGVGRVVDGEAVAGETISFGRRGVARVQDLTIDADVSREALGVTTRVD